MAISFPASPSPGDIYTYNGAKYVYDGVKWVSGGQAAYIVQGEDVNLGNITTGTINSLQYPTAGALSNRNLVINGGMIVSQRGASATVSEANNEGYSTLDRWFLSFNDAPTGAVTFSQSTDAPNGFSNSAKLQCSTTGAASTGNEYVTLQQRIEAQNLQCLGFGTSDAQDMTISWYMKTEGYTDPISLNLITLDGTLEYYSKSVTPTTSWARYSVTVPGSATATIDNDNGVGLYLQFVVAGYSLSSIAATSDSTAFSTTRSDYRSDIGNLLASTSNAIYITGVQLEVGEKATPYEHRAYSDELARCQRYYWEGTVRQANGQAFGYAYPVTMRDTPSSITNTGNATANIVGNDSFYLNSGGTSSNVTITATAEL